MDETVISDDQPIDPSDERLVAYLDGELDTVARDQVEKELLDNEPLRKRLQELQQGWDFLDELPSATPNEKLVETTMEMVVQDIGPAPSRSPQGRSRWIAPLAFLGICALSAGIGYSVSSINRDRIIQLQVDELSMAEDLNAYLDGSDLDLMRVLHDNEDWQRVVQPLTGIQSGQASGAMPAASMVANTPAQERLEKITQMTREEMGALSARWERYRNLPGKTRDAVRRTAMEVGTQPDADSLLNTMRAFSIWINFLPAESRDAVRGKGISGTTPEEVKLTRDKAIAKAIEYTEQELPKRSSQLLSDESAKLIMSALRLILDRRAEDPHSGIERRRFGVQQMLRDRMGGELSESQLRDRADAWLISWMFGDERQSSSRHFREELSQLEQEFVVAALPQEDLDRLDAISGLSPIFRSTAIHEMVAASAERTKRAMALDSGVRYELMSEEERLKLDLLPVDEIRSGLTRDRWRSPRGRER